MFGIKIPKQSEMKDMTPEERKEYVEKIVAENKAKIEARKSNQ